ncbi:MAG: DUF1579 domain-containing protein [Pirellulaceae bacterium]
MSKNQITLILMATLLFGSVLVAQETPPAPAPEKEHKWLQQFVGEWAFESAATMSPGQPEIKSKGKMKSRGLGEMWVLNEITMPIPGAEIIGVQTLGYDPAKKKYVGSWVDSMTNHMWVYEGTVDAAGKKLTLEADGPNFMAPGKTTKFRDEYEFKSADQVIATSSMRGDDGKWIIFMNGTMTRENPIKK